MVKFRIGCQCHGIFARVVSRPEGVSQEFLGRVSYMPQNLATASYKVLHHESVSRRECLTGVA